MRRIGPVAGAVGLGLGLAACGSARTKLPESVPPGPPLQAAPAEPTTLATLATTPEPASETGSPTTASSFKSPGETHPLAGGTLAVSYPRVGVQPRRGVASAPAGLSWTVVNVRFCAGAGDPIGGDLVDPARFRVEVPGQGLVGPAPDVPALAPGPLAAGTAVAPGTCVEGSIAFLIGGEGHVESTSFDSGAGLLRWAT